MHAQLYKGIPQFTKYSTAMETSTILMMARQKGLDVDVYEYMAFGVSYDEAVVFAKITKGSQLAQVAHAHFSENRMTQKDQDVLTASLRRTVELFDMYLAGRLSSEEVLRLQNLTAFTALLAIPGIDKDLMTDGFFADMMNMEKAFKIFI